MNEKLLQTLDDALFCLKESRLLHETYIAKKSGEEHYEILQLYDTAIEKASKLKKQLCLSEKLSL